MNQAMLTHTIIASNPHFGSERLLAEESSIISTCGLNQCVPFPWKLHEMLDEAEGNNFSNIVSWLPDNTSFKVHQPDDFVKVIMPRYFKQTKYKSFQRQLNMWGFKRFLKGEAKGGYSHGRMFIRGQPSLCRYMKRMKIKGNGPKKCRDSPVTTGSTTESGSDRSTPSPPAQSPHHALHATAMSNTNLSTNDQSLQEQQSPPPPTSNTSPSSEVNTKENDDELFDEDTLVSVLSSVFDFNDCADPHHQELQTCCPLSERFGNTVLSSPDKNSRRHSLDFTFSRPERGPLSFLGAQNLLQQLAAGPLNVPRRSAATVTGEVLPSKTPHPVYARSSNPPLLVDCLDTLPEGIWTLDKA